MTDLLSKPRCRRTAATLLMGEADMKVITAERQKRRMRLEKRGELERVWEAEIALYTRVQKLAAREIAAAQKQIDAEEGDGEVL